MLPLLDFEFFIFALLSLIICSDLYKLSSEYNSECTLLPQKLFAFIESDKKVKGRPLAKTYTPSGAVGTCMNLCATHKYCNAVNFNKMHDSENCLLVQSSRIVETEDAPGWLAYKTTSTCIPGCYRNAGMCLQQVNITEVGGRSDSVLQNAEYINDGLLQGKNAYTRIMTSKELIWFRLALGKRMRVVRIILYLTKKEDWNALGGKTPIKAFSVKIGSEEQSGFTAIKKAKYCVYDVSEYPGEMIKVMGKDFAERVDVYCYGPLEGEFVYLSKYTTTDSKFDALLSSEVIIFAEKM